MELRPSRGLKVSVNAGREAVFGEEGISMNQVELGTQEKGGVMTGMTLAGYAEVEMPMLDGKRHWYPVGELAGEAGEKIVEEEIVIEEADDDEDSDE